jgi:hypothetical protein
MGARELLEAFEESIYYQAHRKAHVPTMFAVTEARKELRRRLGVSGEGATASRDTT